MSGREDSSGKERSPEEGRGAHGARPQGKLNLLFALYTGAGRLGRKY